MKLAEVFLRARPGDIIGFTSYSFLGAGINIVTGKCPTRGINHVALVEYSKNWDIFPSYNVNFIFESSLSNRDPCLCCNNKFFGVQIQPFLAKILNYSGPAYWYRSKLFRQDHSSQKSKQFSDLLKSLLHTPYDELGAFRARDLTILEKLLYRKRDISRLYCSELVAYIYYTLFPGYLSENCVYSPNKLLKTMLLKDMLFPAVRIEKK